MAKSFKDVEFIVGIPSYMEADTIAYVTRQVDKGLGSIRRKDMVRQ